MTAVETNNNLWAKMQQRPPNLEPVRVLLIGGHFDRIELETTSWGKLYIDHRSHFDQAITITEQAPFEVIIICRTPQHIPPLQAINLLHKAYPKALKILSTPTPAEQHTPSQKTRYRRYQNRHLQSDQDAGTASQSGPQSAIQSQIESASSLDFCSTLLAIDSAGKVRTIRADRIKSPGSPSLQLIGYCCPISEILQLDSNSSQASNPTQHIDSLSSHHEHATKHMKSSMLASLKDIADHKNSLNELEHLTEELQKTNQLLDRLASHDPLTEVLNRRGFERVLEVHTSNLRRKGTPSAIILADCDDFGKINEIFGHATGDRVLHSMALQLKHGLRPGDYVARIGGDEFLILLPETRLTEAMLVAERLRKSVHEVHLRDTKSPLTIETGMSMSVQSLPNHRCSLADLLELGRDGLQSSKKNGKNQIRSTKKSAVEHADIRALTINWSNYSTVVQPIHRLRDHRIVGYECLSRGPNEPLRMPETFFMVATQSGNLNAVDKKCLLKCIVSCQKLSNSLLPSNKQDFAFHVNLFPSTLLSLKTEALLDYLCPVASPSRFCIELNEKYFVGDPYYIAEKINALRKHGVKIALDEIGFGRSSLEALIILEPDIVKLDRNLVRDCTQDNAKKRILKRLVRVVESLNITIIATGIESSSDLAWIQNLGVQFGQGYYWEEPQPLDVVNTFQTKTKNPQ